jgi:hypothetical protein
MAPIGQEWLPPHSALCQRIEFLGAEIDDAGILGRRRFQGDHIEAVAGAEQVMAAIGRDLAHLRVLVKAVIDRHKIPGELEHRRRQVDRVEDCSSWWVLTAPTVVPVPMQIMTALSAAPRCSSNG